MATPQRPRGAASAGAQTTIASGAPEASPSAAPAGASDGSAAGETSAADVRPPPDDTPKLTTARIEGLEEGELRDMGRIELRVGLDLACQRFETGELVIGHVLSIDEASEGVMLMLDELGWRWPVRLNRVNPALGEWTHVPNDYPAPGADPAWDRAHRMSQTARDEEDLRKEAAAQKSSPTPEAAPAAPAPALAATIAMSVLATWKGPGSLAGPWVRHKDSRQLDLAPAGAKGYFPRNVVEAKVHRKQFEIHSS